MKRLINLILVFSLSFLLAACSAGSSNNVVQYGETLKSEDWEFTFTKTAVGSNLTTSKSSPDYMMPGNEPTTVTYFDGKHYVETERAYVADPEHTYVVVFFKAKWIGKTEVTTSFPNISVEFGDGYSFSDVPYENENFLVDKYGIGYESKSYMDIEPLSDEMSFIKVFIVPKQVETEKDTDLYVVVNLNKKAYKVKVDR